MAWVKLDDNMPDHPKIDGLSDPAFRAYVSGLCVSGRLLTDGVLTEKQVTRIAKTKVREELYAAGLWYPVDACSSTAGIRIHDFLTYNRSRVEVEEERKRKSEAGKQGALKRWGDSRSDGRSHDSRMAAAMAAPNGGSMLPARPVQSEPGFMSSKEKDLLQTEANYELPTAAVLRRLAEKQEAKAAGFLDGDAA